MLAACKPPDETLNSRDDEHSGGCFDQSFAVYGQIVVATERGEGTLEDPSQARISSIRSPEETRSGDRGGAAATDASPLHRMDA